jgi:hypothetical protein
MMRKYNATKNSVVPNAAPGCPDWQLYTMRTMSGESGSKSSSWKGGLAGSCGVVIYREDSSMSRDGKGRAQFGAIKREPGCLPLKLP